MSIGSDNGLVPNTVWHQAIIWTNDAQFTDTYLYHQVFFYENSSAKPTLNLGHG